MSVGVLYIISSLRRSGPVNVLYSIVKDAHINNIKPLIVTLKPESERSKLSDFLDLNIEVLNIGRNKTTLKKLIDIVKKKNIRIVHSHGLVPDFFNALLHKKNKNVYSISTLHNFPFEDYRFAYGLVPGFLLAIVHCTIIKSLICVSCSETIKEKFQKLHFYTASIPNGIEVPDYSKIVQKYEKFGNVFLYLGEINKRKNVRLLIEAFKKLPNYELWLVGDGPELDRLRKKNQYRNIKFMGRTEQPASFFLRSDYYISASLSEGLPMACLEAMSYGLPVVLSDISSHREILNKQVGVLFSKNSQSDLIKNVHKIVSKNVASKIVYDYIQHNYNSARVSREYADLYSNLIDNRF